MIAYIKGDVFEISTEYVVLDVNQIGYKVYMPYRSLVSLPPKGESILVHTYFYVREDIMALYGFMGKEELDAFELLLEIPKIGPKVALGILSTYDPSQLKSIIVNEDVPSLTAIPGIGKKTGQRMVLELAEKMKKFMPQAAVKDREGIPADDIFIEAKEALSVLGYSDKEIDEALRQLKKEEKDHSTSEELIRRAMRYIKGE